MIRPGFLKLEELGYEPFGIVLKIEPLSDFVQLPKLILAAMHSKRASVWGTPMSAASSP